MEDRYIRQTILKEFGQEAQDKLLGTTVSIVGCGGLGAVAAAYLAGAGIGNLRLIDGDAPDISNVHRQVFYTGSESEFKSKVLQTRLQELNPEIHIDAITSYIAKDNIDEILAGSDIVLEGSDDLTCKYLVNDFCALEGIPMVYGAIHKYEGYVSFFRNKVEEDIHLRDIFPNQSARIPSCSEVGVLNVLPGIIGLLQANEVIKCIAGIGENLQARLLTYNCLDNRQYIVNLKKQWTEDIEDFFERNNYTSDHCEAVPELEVSELMERRTSFNLISVMPEEEHIAIDNETRNLAISEINSTFQGQHDGKDVVVYCRSGRVSKSVVQNLITANPSLKIYSLKDGVRAYQKFKALN